MKHSIVPDFLMTLWVSLSMSTKNVQFSWQRGPLLKMRYILSQMQIEIYINVDADVLANNEVEVNQVVCGVY